MWLHLCTAQQSYGNMTSSLGCRSNGPTILLDTAWWSPVNSQDRREGVERRRGVRTIPATVRQVKAVAKVITLTTSMTSSASLTPATVESVPSTPLLLGVRGWGTREHDNSSRLLKRSSVKGVSWSWKACLSNTKCASIVGQKKKEKSKSCCSEFVTSC